MVYLVVFLEYKLFEHQLYIFPVVYYIKSAKTPTYLNLLYLLPIPCSNPKNIYFSVVLEYCNLIIKLSNVT